MWQAEGLALAGGAPAEADELSDAQEKVDDRAGALDEMHDLRTAAFAHANLVESMRHWGGVLHNVLRSRPRGIQGKWLDVPRFGDAVFITAGKTVAAVRWAYDIYLERQKNLS
jgi:hypothetical protein